MKTMNDHNVNFNFTFRNTDASDAVKDYATEKLTISLKKFIHQDVDAHVILDVEKRRQIAELSVHCYGQDFNCKEESESMYKSLDAIVEKISKQLRRHKDKVTDHH